MRIKGIDSDMSTFLSSVVVLQNIPIEDKKPSNPTKKRMITGKIFIVQS